MKKYITLVLLTLITLSCKTSKGVGQEVTNSPKHLTDEVFFTAIGNEPFWKLSISRKEIVLTTLANDETYTFPYTEAIKAMDANVKLYRSLNEKGKIEITINHKECVNDMSGLASPYSVSVRFKKNDTAEADYKGCGEYQLPLIFQDIWVLEELNGKKVTLSDFTKKLPYFEINAKEKSYQGFGGCNGLGGTLFYEPSVLRFERGMSTLMYCGDNNKENELYVALGKVTQYTFKETHMVLSNPDGVLVIMKKVD